MTGLSALVATSLAAYAALCLIVMLSHAVWRADKG
jgi:hypothetical protein